MAKVEVDLHSLDGYLQKVGRSANVNATLKGRAEAVAAQARAIAPRATGQYADSITVEKTSTPYRTIYAVKASDWKAQIIEARYGVLSRALNMAKG